jgi:hypothetical protein
VRAIDGAVLAGEILAGLNETVATKGETKLNIVRHQFKDHWRGVVRDSSEVNRFSRQLQKTEEREEIPDYASSMVFELVTNASGTDFPTDKSDLSVRFMFHKLWNMKRTLRSDLSVGKSVPLAFVTSSKTIDEA